MEPPPVPEPDPTRRGYLTFAQVTCARSPPIRRGIAAPHGDLQMHTTDSDGRLAFLDMMAAARASGLAYAAITDHSESLHDRARAGRESG